MTSRRDKAREKERRGDERRERKMKKERERERKVKRKMSRRKTDEKLAARIWERKRYSERERGKREGDIKREKENPARSAGQGGERKAKGSKEWRGSGRGMEGELRWIANSSHINKREDTVCEAAEKPPSLQPPAGIAGFERTLETY